MVSNRACCLLVLVSAVGLGLVKKAFPIVELEVVLLVYSGLLYWHDGLTWQQARRDLAYALKDARHQLLLIPSERVGKETLALPARLDDHATAVCKTALYTALVSDSFVPNWAHNMETADPVPASERVRLFLEECRGVYAGLEQGGEQRRILDRLLPGVSGNKTQLLPVFVASRALRSRREEVAKSRADFSSRWVPEDQLGPFADSYVRHGFRPVRPQVIRASEIPDAIIEGRVARFDATEFLPRDFFNKSIVDIAALHEDVAEEIPVYREAGASAPSRSGWESLAEYARRTEAYRRAGSHIWPEFRPWYNDEPTGEQHEVRRQLEPPTWYLRLLHGAVKSLSGFDLSDFHRSVRRSSLQAAVNMRRLPRVPQSIETALGSPGWLERTWNMLWLGPVGDCWHYDDPDNLLIAVHGDIWVTVMEDPADSDLLRAGGGRGCWTGPRDYFISSHTHSKTLDEHRWFSKFPAISFKLEPGMGVTVPSGTYHSLTMPSGDRVLMNCFFIPKFGRMWDGPRSEHGFYSSRRQTREYAALRSLKMASVGRVWDLHRVGGWFEAFKLELL